MGKRETMRSKANPVRKSSKQSALTVNRIFWEVGIRARDQSTPLDYSFAWARKNDKTGQRISQVGR
jgi:hypothetical protein